MSDLFVDNIKHQSSQGSGTITIGASGETVSMPTNLTLSDNILFNAANKGVYLGVTTATASNLLDDYEEGTWTPSITSGLASFTVQNASYTKIGRIVNIQFYANNLTSKDSNQIVLGGLPFTSGSGTFATGVIEGSVGKIGIIRVGENANTFNFYFANTSTGDRTNYIGTMLGSHIILSFTYQTT